ncbi:MAG: glycosyltransferase family 39 protein, partial [Bacteroidales bacterium]|nr:glycosyltransferase family 39 protein [Bacteroidales bacterium]
MNRKLPGLLFIFLMIAVAFFYQYHQIVFKRPQSVHAWRQADGASLALNYAREGMDFFNPEVHNLTSDDGTSGKSATSEIPVLYYFVAVLYKLFGTHEFIYRLVNTVLFLIGLFCLFRAIRMYTEDLFWAFAIPLSLFASPVLVYYGNNFLSNTTALSMVFIAWYFVFRYLKFHQKKDLLWMFFFFFLGGAMKITALFSFFALAMIFLLEWTGFFRANQPGKLFPHQRTAITGGIVTLLPIIAWIVYARIFNENHTTTYFSTTLFPIWTLEKEGIQDIISGIRKLWLKEYFHLSFLYFLAALAVISIIFINKTSKFILLAILFLVTGMGIYIILQFWTFRDHDYYTINMFILPVFLMIAFARILQALKISSTLKTVLKISISIFLIFNIIYARDTSQARYTSWKNDNFKRMRDFYTITPVLRDHGITREDTVISFSDLSHVSLYLMDQK